MPHSDDDVRSSGNAVNRSDANRASRPLRLVLMGTGPFAVPSFEALRVAGHEIVAVVTRPLPPVKSRKGPPPSPVRTWAETHEFAILDPASINTPEAIAAVAQIRPDLLVVCDYGQILKPDALKTAPLGGINLHGSLLPKFRGAAPVQWALLSGEDVTGVSVIHMTPRLDGGPIINTRSSSIDSSETAGQLEERLSQIGVDATLEAVEMISNWDGASPMGHPQDPQQVSKAPRLRKADAEIDWSRSSKEIDCLVRGMQPWPVAFTHFAVHEGKPPLRLAIREVRDTKEPAQPNSSPGDIVAGDGLRVATGDNLIEILRVQPAGKREMSGEEFQRGHQPTEGSRFGSA